MEGLPKVTSLDLITHASLAVAAPWSSSYIASGSQPNYVIIGAGFALADKLSKNAKIAVVLLEAGPENAGVVVIDVPGYTPDLLNTQYT